MSDEEDDIIIYHNISPLSNSIVEWPKTKASQKYKGKRRTNHSNVHSFTEKDWGDVLRWVLPPAGDTFLVRTPTKRRSGYCET